MSDAQEIATAVANAITEERLQNDPVAREFAMKRAMNEHIRGAAKVGRVQVETSGDDAPITGGGLDQGSQGDHVPAPSDPKATMNDLMRNQFLGGGA